MPYSLKSRNVLITAGSRGLGALVATKFAREGSNIAINYHSRKDEADALGAKLQREHGVKTIVLQGDAGSSADCARLVADTVEGLGGLDVLIGNAGYTKIAEFGDLDGCTEEDWDMCWAVNVKGQMALMRAAAPVMNKNPDGGAFIITSSVAGVKQMGSSMPYSVTKAAGLHLMKCLASTQGPKIRVNAVLPGLIMTEWSARFDKAHIDRIRNVSKLKMIVSCVHFG